MGCSMGGTKDEIRSIYHLKRLLWRERNDVIQDSLTPYAFGTGSVVKIKLSPPEVKRPTERNTTYRLVKQNH